MNSVRKKVYETLSSVLSGGETLVVGFSGGADSVTLLHVLVSLKEDLHLADVVAVHIDHQLRGEESARDRLFAQTFCQQIGVSMQVFSYDVKALAQKEGKGLEETGREVRYQAFNEVAATFEDAYVATAHTANDNAETVLLHLCRGCGIRGMQGIPLKRDNLLRPLLSCTRAEIETYCQENNLPFVNDSTNTDVSYARNRIRHRILPEMVTINSATIQALNRLSSHASEATSFLESEVDRLFSSIVSAEKGRFYRQPVCEQHPFLQSLLLERSAQSMGVTTDDYHLSQMRRCVNDGGTISLPGEYHFKTSGEYYYILSPEEAVPPSVPFSAGETTCFFDNRYRLSVVSREEYEQKLNICKLVFQNACDYDMISGVVTLRSRVDGDAFRPAGRGCTKTLKKLFNETKILPEKRAQIPILCDENGIILVADHGCDERVKITKATPRVLILEKDEE